MYSYVLTCCSTADMTKEYFEERHIPFVSFHFILDGKEYLDDLGQSIPFDEYYQIVSEGSMPTTSQVNIGEFTQFFEPFLKEGKDILHISFSSGLSGAYTSARIASKELLRKYPDRKILVIDSLAASSGYGLLVDKAADMRDEGETIEETYSFIESNKLNLNHWFFSTDLTHYKRGGRISATSAKFGTLLNICPLLNMNNEGELIPREKIRGKNRVIKDIVKKMELNAKNGTDYSGKCFISHSNCYEDARKVYDLIEEKFPELEGPSIINYVGTVIGAHTGPGTVALFFFGDKRES